MKQEYNRCFLELETNYAQLVNEMKEELSKEVREQISRQIDPVCAVMKLQLLDCWENGDAGAEVFGNICIELPKEPLSRTYKEVLNAVVKEQLEAYGFEVTFDCGEAKNPAIALVSVNLVHALYSSEDNWCHCLAQGYLSSKVNQTVMVLRQFVDSQKDCGKQFVRITLVVKIPSVIRELFKDRVKEEMPLLWYIDPFGGDDITFEFCLA